MTQALSNDLEYGWILKCAHRAGYESRDDACGCAHHKGAAENPQENSHGFEKGRGVKHVCVCTSRLVGHDGAEM